MIKGDGKLFEAREDSEEGKHPVLTKNLSVRRLRVRAIQINFAAFIFSALLIGLWINDTYQEVSNEIDEQVKQSEARVADLKAQEETLLNSIKQKLADHVERFMAAYIAMFENILNNRSAFINANQVLTIFRSTNEDARNALFDQVDSNQAQLQFMPNIKLEGKAIHTDIHNKFKEMVRPKPEGMRSPSSPRP